MLGNTQVNDMFNTVSKLKVLIIIADIIFNNGGSGSSNSICFLKEKLSLSSKIRVGIKVENDGINYHFWSDSIDPHPNEFLIATENLSKKIKNVLEIDSREEDFLNLVKQALTKLE